MARLRKEIVIRASVKEVWARFSDQRRLGDWLVAGSVEVTRPGEPDEDGVGCRRVVRAGGFRLEEEIRRFSPPRELDYQLVGGLPGLKHHHGRCRLAEFGGGTRLTWEVDISLRPLHPMWLIWPVLLAKLGRSLEQSLEKLKALIEEGATPSR